MDNISEAEFAVVSAHSDAWMEKQLSTERGRLEHAISCNGDIDQLRTLIASGADVNVPDLNPGENYSLLHVAAMQDWREFEDGRMKLLLEAGAKVDALANTQAGRPWTPLMLACNEGNPDSVLRLLQWKANPNLQDDIGRTPLFLAASNATFMHEAIFGLLVAGADPTIATHFGDTPLSVFMESRPQGETPHSDSLWNRIEGLLRNG